MFCCLIINRTTDFFQWNKKIRKTRITTKIVINSFKDFATKMIKIINKKALIKAV